MRSELEEQLQVKEQALDVPKQGMAVLEQQRMLAEAVEVWLASLVEGFCD